METFRTYDVEYFKFGPLHQITTAKLQLFFDLQPDFEKFLTKKPFSNNAEGRKKIIKKNEMSKYE